MIDVKPLKAEDVIWVIENGVKEVGLKATPTKDIEEKAKEREESGTCMTGWVNDEIIGCAGIDIMWEGVGEAWLMLTPAVHKYLKDSWLCIQKGFKELIEKNKLRRIQAHGRIGFDECHILFKHLGFKPEGIARKYTPDGVDCIMYALIREL